MTTQTFKLSRTYPIHQYQNWISQTSELIETIPLPDSVLFWGAKADGITNDTAAIQRAFDSLNPVTGGIICFPPGVYNVPGAIRIAANHTTICAYSAQFLIGASLVPGATWCDFSDVSYFTWRGGFFTAVGNVSCMKCDTEFIGTTAISDFRFQNMDFRNCFYAINIRGFSTRKVTNVDIDNITIVSPTAAPAGGINLIDTYYGSVSNVNIKGGNNTSMVGISRDSGYITVVNVNTSGMNDTSSVDASMQCERCNTFPVTFVGCVSDHDLYISDSSNVNVTGCIFRQARVSVGDGAAHDRICFNSNQLGSVQNPTIGVPAVGSLWSGYFSDNVISSSGVIVDGVAVATSIFLSGTYVQNIYFENNKIITPATTNFISLTRVNASSIFYFKNNQFGSAPPNIIGSAGWLLDSDNSKTMIAASSNGYYIVARQAVNAAVASSSFATVPFDTEVVDINAELAANVFTPKMSGLYRYSGIMMLNSTTVPVAGDRWEMRLQNTTAALTITPVLKRMAETTVAFSVGIPFMFIATLTAGSNYVLQYRDVDAAETGAGASVTMVASSYVNIQPLM